MNVQYWLIQELMLYEFDLGHKAMEATKNIHCANDEGTIDISAGNLSCLQPWIPSLFSKP